MSRNVVLWTAALVAVVAGFLGIWTGFNLRPESQSVVRLAAAAVMISLGGVMVLFPRAMYAPRQQIERGLQTRTIANGAALIVFGAAQLVPNIGARLALFVLGFVIVVAALRGVPKRLFPPTAAGQRSVRKARIQ
jgi:hypothetical protein